MSEARIRELEVQVEMLERLISMMERDIQRNDENFKIALQASKTTNKHQILSNNIKCKLLTTFKENLLSVSDDKIQRLLEEKAPAYGSLIQLMENGLCGSENLDSQLLQLATNKYCKFLNESGDLVTQPLSDAFDSLFIELFTRCQPVVMRLTEELEKNHYSETSHKKDNTRYENTRLLYETKAKQRMIKELCCMLK